MRLTSGASGVGVLTGQAGPGLLLLDELRGCGASVPDLADPTQARLVEPLPPLTYQRTPRRFTAAGLVALDAVIIPVIIDETEESDGHADR